MVNELCQAKREEILMFGLSPYALLEKESYLDVFFLLLLLFFLQQSSVGLLLFLDIQSNLQNLQQSFIRIFSCCVMQILR